jgi:CRISPR/Cas system CMR-associated protein Cmr5 small subunit
VTPVERKDAVTFLKEISDAQNISPDAVSFEKSKDSTGISVRIKGQILDLDKQRLKEIAKKHSLEVKEDKDEVLVYKP